MNYHRLLYLQRGQTLLVLLMSSVVCDVAMIAEYKPVFYVHDSLHGTNNFYIITAQQRFFLLLNVLKVL